MRNKRIPSVVSLAKNRYTTKMGTNTQYNHIVGILTTIFIESRVSKISVVVGFGGGNLVGSSMSDKYRLSSPLDNGRFTRFELFEVKFKSTKSKNVISWFLEMKNSIELPK